MRLKRLIAFVLTVLCVVSLSACGGKTEDVKVTVGESSLYGRGDLLDAADAVMDDFKKGFDHCKLLRVEYSEGHTLRESEHRREHYGDADVVVFVADFYVGFKALAVGPLIPGQTCSNYQFIGVRDNRGEWVVRDKGYG